MEANTSVLKAGDKILVGDQIVAIPDELAKVFSSGDSLIGIPDTGSLLHVRKADRDIAYDAVSKAVAAFAEMSRVDQSQVSDFYRNFAAALSDNATFEAIAKANAEDVSSAVTRGRSTTRLLLSDSMREDMIAGLRMWADAETTVGHVEATVDRDGLEVELVRQLIANQDN